ncbi:MAG: acyl carrier protein, partial [Maricaulaceae bacterium]
ALDEFDYVDSGHVDSLGLMKFIAALESALDIELTDADIESDRFRLVGGLVALLEERAAERSPHGRSAAS